MRLALLAGLAAAAILGEAAEPAGYDLLRRILSDSAAERREASRRLIESRDASLVPGLVDAFFFLPRNHRAEALAALTALTGERPGERYHDWVELVGRRGDLVPGPGYLEWKAGLLSRIDPAYARVLYPGARVRIRLEEVVSGGVGFEGIPALDQPAHVPAAAAGYLKDEERVFGVSLGGERRAYPLRILGWHEMVNDRVGGEPVTLSYCTLCGSGVLYGTRTRAGGAYTFGTSGLLYRSNKLMVDRQTLTLWSNLTGEPVVGRLAQSPVRLTLLPLTLTTWKEWRRRHPETTVLALDEAAARRWGFDYRPGAADRRRQGVSFPVWPRSAALDGNAEVFALRLGDRTKVWPVEAALRERVINDRLGEVDVVVVADPESGAVRAYRREGRTFAAGPRPDLLADASGRLWTAGEDALSLAADGADGADGAGGAVVPLPRLPGHHAFWRGWYAFFPRTEVYRLPEERL